MYEAKKWNVTLRYERELRGWSQGRVAKALGTDAKKVSDWERGRAKPSPHYRAKLVKLFGKNAAEFGFIDQDDTETGASDTEPQQDTPLEETPNEIDQSQTASPTIHVIFHETESKHIDVDQIRRGLLQAFGRTAVTLIVAPHKLYAQQFGYIVNEHLVAFLEGELHARWLLYYTGGAGNASLGLESWMQEVSSLVTNSRGTIWHERALVLLAMSYQLQGCVFRDIMRYPEAYQALRKAFLVAQELHDPELMASSLAREGIMLNQQGHPDDAIVCLTGAIETIKRLDYQTLEGYILQGLSEAQAQTQQAQMSWRSLGLAEETLGRSAIIPERSMSRLNISSLTAQRGVNAALLHDHEQAIKLIDSSLKGYDPSLIRGRARLIVQKAEAFYSLGRIEESTAAAQEAFMLAEAAGANRTVTRVSSLHTALIQTKWSKEQGIVQLGAMLLSRKA